MTVAVVHLAADDVPCRRLSHKVSNGEGTGRNADWLRHNSAQFHEPHFTWQGDRYKYYDQKVA